ncbi:occludin/ELL domain-containing protein 1 isoform X2 [Prionailurus bengalensis]|uniref:occludin/ELL domain-containing protein 1 isoform X2 n=1 Tax=Prionailurus bengalensis TaxID=37029 RepID=UPI001CA9B6C1|nr:occludin/ELL domain-containing protein 1 isoform X2 [Prionailurus bengalensis]
MLFRVTQPGAGCSESQSSACMQIATEPASSRVRGELAAPGSPPCASSDLARLQARPSVASTGSSPTTPATRGRRRPSQDPPAAPGTPERRLPEADAYPGEPQDPRLSGGSADPPAWPWAPVFQDQYTEFLELQQEVGCARAKLQQLETLLNSLPRPRSQKEAQLATRVWREFKKKQTDPSFLDKQARCHYLKGKLRHLKTQIQKFDEQGDQKSSVYF